MEMLTQVRKKCENRAENSNYMEQNPS